MPSLPYNVFLNAMFTQALSGFVRKDGGGYGLAAIRIGCSELNIGTFGVRVIFSVQQDKAHPAPQKSKPRSATKSPG